jgi:4-hydroxy-3-methylbut-2-enyl diphosphate reductase IspH
LVLSLNAGAVEDAEKFNKKAYLDLSKPYTYNWNNSPSYTKKDNQATLFLKEAGSTLRGTIGSTNSNNTNKLSSTAPALSDKTKRIAVKRYLSWLNALESTPRYLPVRAGVEILEKMFLKQCVN